MHMQMVVPLCTREECTPRLDSAGSDPFSQELRVHELRDVCRWIQEAQQINCLWAGDRLHEQERSGTDTSENTRAMSARSTGEEGNITRKTQDGRKT